MANGTTTTFSDDTAVTAGDLNNIAIDLGKTDFAVFSSDEKFGNDKLNRITADLVSSGILNLNDRCKCTLTKDGSQISVAKGVAVFGDGSKIRVNEAQTLDIIAGGTNYVYFKNDTITGKATLENSLTEPVGDFVMMCQVSGSLNDLRQFAQAKVSLTTATYEEITLDETVSFELNEDNGWSSEINIKIPVNKNSYDYIVLMPNLSDTPYYMSFYDINNKKGLCFYYERFGTDHYDYTFTDLFQKTENTNSYKKYYAIRFVSLDNNILTLKLYAKSSADTTWTVPFNQTFLLI